VLSSERGQLAHELQDVLLKALEKYPLKERLILSAARSQFSLMSTRMKAKNLERSR
jgi:hypothetical protein